MIENCCKVIEVIKISEMIYYNMIFDRSYGIATEMISPKEAQEMWPLMRVDDIKVTCYMPEMVNSLSLKILVLFLS